MMGFPEVLESLDRELFLLINGFHNQTLDAIMVWMSDKKSWIPFYALLIYPLWLCYKKKIYIPFLAVAILILLSDQLSVNLFKNVFERYRPCHNLELEGLVHTVNGKCGGKFGFISSHAANTFSLAVFLSLQFYRRFKWLCLVLLFWAAVVSYSRIYLGAHYPFDVLGGALFGAFLAWVVHMLMSKVKRSQKVPAG